MLKNHKFIQNLIVSNVKLKQHGWGLSAKLTAAYSVLIVLVAGMLTANLYLHLRTAQLQAIRDRIFDLVSLATPQIDSDYHSLIISYNDQQRPYYQILWKRLQTIQATTKGINRIYTLRHLPNDKIVYVIDYSPPPKSIATVGETVTNLTPLLEAKINNITGPIVEEHLLQNQDAKPILYGYAPIIDAMGRREGILVIELDASAVIQSEIQARNLALITFLITLPIAVSIGWWLARRLTSPIAELVVVAEAIAQGQLEQTVKVYSKDEVGTLANAFNHMSHQLKESFDTLEAKVAKRTTELAQANQEISGLNQRLRSENIRMGAELEVTRRLQMMILPKQQELESIEGLEIAGFMEPADEVGGDYYDVLQKNGLVKISIGDVTGHGLESGVIMLMAQTAVRTLQESNQTDPVQFLDILNNTIYKNIQRINPAKSLTLALLDYADGILSLSGQHEEVIVVRSGGKVERIDTMNLGFPIGLDEEIADFIASEQIQINSGDVVILYTDGITEAFDINRQQYGIERLCEVASRNCSLSVEGIRQAVIDDVRQHIGSQKVFDDITLVVLKQK
jgi:sigma-B regulation protein RsbU (phosphoserine phosphatase)